MTSQHYTTDLLIEGGAGEREAYDRLFPAVYDELHRIAHRQLQRERSGHTLDTTSLVHECYLNLIDRTRSSWNDRAHFLAVAAKAMRHILIDYARNKAAQKRGGERRRVTLEAETLAVEAQAVELISLDRALSELARRHARLGAVVECRFFGGMTVDETAAALDVSKRTVERDWTRAKAYLQQELHPNEAGG